MTPRETLTCVGRLPSKPPPLPAFVEMAEQRIPLMPSGCKGIAITDMPRGGNDATAAAIARVDGWNSGTCAFTPNWSCWSNRWRS
jgi:hypothetical protein